MSEPAVVRRRRISGTTDHWSVKEGKRIYRRREATVELTIDVEKLMRKLGYAALFAKTGKAVLAYGLVTCRVVGEVIREPVEVKP